jgi:uncharacterized BrkB/YihY/UPF0761 family membrane protein
MQVLGRPAAHMLHQAGAFSLRTLKSFRANQGLLLAGAVAYYALLLVVPLLYLLGVGGEVSCSRPSRDLKARAVRPMMVLAGLVSPRM